MPTLSTVQFGSAPGKLANSANGSFFSYPNDICGINSTRSVHTANFSVPQGKQVFYRVTSDGLTWSSVYNTTGIIRSKLTQTFSIFGDLAVYNSDNAAPALANDTREGVHDFIVHCAWAMSPPASPTLPLPLPLQMATRHIIWMMIVVPSAMFTSTPFSPTVLRRPSSTPTVRGEALMNLNEQAGFC